MSKEKKDVAESASAAENVSQQQGNTAKKTSRRGVASARGPQRLKFSHENAHPNGLFVGHLDSVVVSDIVIGENTSGLPSFNGLAIPRIVFTFASNEAEIPKRRFVNLQFSAVESNANTIPGGKEEWKVNAIFDWFKHIYNVFVLKGRELTEEEENALSLGFEDFNEEGEYVPVEPEEVIAAWKVLFENFENLLNRGADELPVYADKSGKAKPVWLKLLRYVKNKKKGWQAVNNGDLSLPTFIGEGAIELFVPNSKPSLRLDTVKEAIIPMDIDKAKSPNMGGIPMPGSNMGGVPMGDPMAPAGFEYNINNAAGDDDVPF